MGGSGGWVGGGWARLGGKVAEVKSVVIDALSRHKDFCFQQCQPESPMCYTVLQDCTSLRDPDCHTDHCGVSLEVTQRLCDVHKRWVLNRVSHTIEEIKYAIAEGQSASGAVEGRYEVKVDLYRPLPRPLTTSTLTTADHPRPCRPVPW